MDYLTRILLYILLVLFQVTILPMNLAFALLVGESLLIKDYPAPLWLFLVSFLVSLFGNLNLGLVVLAFAFALLIISLTKRFIPNNRATKAVIIAGSLPLANIALLIFGSFLK